MFEKQAKNQSTLMMPAAPSTGTCWACGRATVFQPLQVAGGLPPFEVRPGQLQFPDAQMMAATGGQRVGLRVCSDASCGSLVLVVFAPNSQTPTFHPAPGVHFDQSNVPADIVAALNEAILCHRAGAYRGAAALVRRAVELTCDAKGAKTGMLGVRIRDLRKQALLPEAILEGMDHIAFLGNDAMHVEMRQFDDVDGETVETAIKVTTEILRALYQAESLMTALGRLRKPTKD